MLYKFYLLKFVIWNSEKFVLNLCKYNVEIESGSYYMLWNVENKSRYKLKYKWK